MSRLRITGGAARGRILREPVGEGIRPTAERVREALFSIVGQDLAGRSFLDAFGGSGVVALEAWSRGAAVTVFEREARHARAISARAASIAADVDVRVGVVERRAAGRWDVVFADPPYAAEPGPILTALAELAGEVLVYEAPTAAALPERVGALRLDRVRPHGAAALWVYRPA